MSSEQTALGVPCGCLGSPIDPVPGDPRWLYACRRCGAVWSREAKGGSVAPLRREAAEAKAA